MHNWNSSLLPWVALMALFYLFKTTLGFLYKWCYSIRKKTACYPRQPQINKKTKFFVFVFISFQFLKPICSNIAILWCKGVQSFCNYQAKVIKHRSLQTIHSSCFCKEQSRMIPTVCSRHMGREQHCSFCPSLHIQRNKASDVFAGKCARGGREWCSGSWVLVILMMTKPETFKK